MPPAVTPIVTVPVAARSIQDQRTKVAARIVPNVPKQVEDVIATEVAIGLPVTEPVDIVIESQQRWRCGLSEPAMISRWGIFVPVCGLAMFTMKDVVKVCLQWLAHKLVLPICIPAGDITTQVMVLCARRHPPHPSEQMSWVLQEATARGRREL